MFDPIGRYIDDCLKGHHTRIQDHLGQFKGLSGPCPLSLGEELTRGEGISATIQEVLGSDQPASFTRKLRLLTRCLGYKGGHTFVGSFSISSNPERKI